METLFHGTNVILIALVNYYEKKRWGEKGGEGQNWHGLKAWTIILIKQPMKLLELEKKHYDTNQRLVMDI